MNQSDDLKTTESFRDSAKSPQPGILAELTQFMIHSKRWWLVPLMAVLLIMGLMILVTNTAIIPGIYMLF